jgi:hypothetical protein
MEKNMITECINEGYRRNLEQPFEISQAAIDDIRHNVINPLTIILLRIQTFKVLETDTKEMTDERISSLKRVAREAGLRVTEYLKQLQPDVTIQPSTFKLEN